MSPTDQILNAPGTVTIGDRVLTVSSLSMREERALWGELSAIISEDSNPFTRAAPVLESLEKAGKHVERGVLLEHLCRVVSSNEPVPDRYIESSRRTNPKVLVRELYRRAKKYHPDLQEESLTAVITKTNVADVWADLEAALGSAADPKETP